MIALIRDGRVRRDGRAGLSLRGLVTGAADAPLVIPALNRDGDTLSDLVMQMFGTIAGAVLGVGGLTNYGTLTVERTIVGDNPGELNCYQTAGTSQGYNIDEGDECGFTQPTDHHDTDAKLGTLGFTGNAFSPTEPLSPSSPAVDNGGRTAMPRSPPATHRC